MPDKTQWISVAEATELAGIHLTTMYDRIKLGAVRSKMSDDKRPKCLVDFDSLCEMMGTERTKAPPGQGKSRSSRAARRAKRKHARSKPAPAPAPPLVAMSEPEPEVVEVLSPETAALLKAVSESKWKSNRGDVGKAIQKWRKAGMPDAPMARCEHCGSILDE
jgi:hypothetical protein